MSRSARHDAASFGVILFAILCCCTCVTGNGGFFWILLSLIPVFILASGLDRK